MVHISLLPITMILGAFPNTTNDLCNGLHRQKECLSKKSVNDVLPVLKLKVPLEHPDQFWMYGLRLFETTSNSTTEQGNMLTRSYSLQIANVKEIFN